MAESNSEGMPRPNIAKAGLQLPAVKDYEQVDREIIATLRPTKGWFVALVIAIICLIIGGTAWTYQITKDSASRVTTRPSCGACTSSPSCSGSVSDTRVR